MKTKKTKKTIKIKFTTKIIITLIVTLIALIAVLLLVFFISYNAHMNKMNELAEETINIQEQEIKLPSPPEERYVSGIIQSVQEESFIVNLKNGKQEEIFFNAQTEVLKGEGRGVIVSKEEIQSNYHVACFLPEDKNNNIALIVHIISKYYDD